MALFKKTTQQQQQQQQEDPFRVSIPKELAKQFMEAADSVRVICCVHCGKPTDQCFNKKHKQS